MTPQFILDAIAKEVERITIEEAKRAEGIVRARVAEAAAAIAVTIMRQIRITDSGDEIVIRVENKL